MQGYVVLSCKSLAYSVSTHHSAPDVDEMKCAESALFFASNRLIHTPARCKIHQNTTRVTIQNVPM